ncbi:DUF4272 domain-containing protein [Longispora sp. K20-0274]|uniref:DUF4272 domain-containing protein n=1 Tax=Longispora sp. K20-0274 TaxID=3088255 RepID=UPI00399A3DF3
MDPTALRSASIEELRRLRAPTPGRRLPLSFRPGALIGVRPVAELEARVAVLHVAYARTLGMPTERAMDWLLDAHILRFVHPAEWRFIVHGDGDSREHAAGIESATALCWVLGLRDDLDPLTRADGRGLPDLRGGERYADWRSRTLTAVREPEEAAALLDLYVCLDWSCHEAATRGLDPALVGSRLAALEWAVTFD